MLCGVYIPQQADAIGVSQRIPQRYHPGEILEYEVEGSNKVRSTICWEDGVGLGGGHIRGAAAGMNAVVTCASFRHEQQAVAPLI